MIAILDQPPAGTRTIRERRGRSRGSHLMIDRDPRMQVGAYITDGIDLYEVTGMQRGPGVMGMSTVRIAVENCRNLRCLELLPDKVRTAFDLVRAAPVGRCPDLLEDIPSDPDPALHERRAA